MTADIAALLERVLQSPRRQARRVVAIAGPPASGKSTLAAALVSALQQAGVSSQLVPMDGFHLDNRILTARGILDRKGSPPSFDAIGLLRLVQLLGASQELYYPVFDRDRDLSIAGAGHIAPDCDTIVIEGNYLLMDAPIWHDMAGYWDLSIQLTCAEAELEARLNKRWLDQGLTPEAARLRAQSNDLPNARLVGQTALRADVVL
jgi:pantothenate kinase